MQFVVSGHQRGIVFDEVHVLLAVRRGLDEELTLPAGHDAVGIDDEKPIASVF